MLLNGIHNGIVYDWASVLADRMEEFMTLQHRTFYMPYHAIGFFLDAVRLRGSPDKHLAPQGHVHLGQPPIFYWMHLDTTAPSGDIHSGTKRKRRVVVSASATESESTSSDPSEEAEDSDMATETSFRMVGQGGQHVEEDMGATSTATAQPLNG